MTAAGEAPAAAAEEGLAAGKLKPAPFAAAAPVAICEGVRRCLEPQSMTCKDALILQKRTEAMQRCRSPGGFMSVAVPQQPSERAQMWLLGSSSMASDNDTA